MGQQKSKFVERKNESKDWGLVLLIFSIFIFIGGLFYEGSSGEKSSASHSRSMQPSNDPNRIYNNLNSRLKETAVKEEILRQSVEAESAVAPSTQAGEDPEVSGYDENTHPFKLDQENPGQQVLRDTERKRRSTNRPLTPDQRISSKLEKEAFLQEDERRRQEEYVRQFLQNAKKQGVNIKLNKNLDVTGIEAVPVERPIRVPQSTANGSK
jgi:hypothetical protein